mmetsp:Transcript_46978/g.150965  ORF Transcript_46978/g.150965 Transcript_46978/m.150965 type:complete len:167 (+) Transcript_46978:243-743(+)
MVGDRWKDHQLRKISEAVGRLAASHLPLVPYFAPFALEELEPSSSVFRFFAELVCSSVQKHRTALRSSEWAEPPQLEVIAMQQALNFRLSNGYKQKMEELMGLRRHGCTVLPELVAGKVEPDRMRLNETFLFHGAQPAVLDKIVKGGLILAEAERQLAACLVSRPT